MANFSDGVGLDTPSLHHRSKGRTETANRVACLDRFKAKSKYRELRASRKTVTGFKPTATLRHPSCLRQYGRTVRIFARHVAVLSETNELNHFPRRDRVGKKPFLLRRLRWMVFATNSTPCSTPESARTLSLRRSSLPAFIAYPPHDSVSRHSQIERASFYGEMGDQEFERYCNSTLKK